ncbi:hypothetical protein Pan216_01130 [Planctomycetes bacterium Pan216]|uniref:Big-1 domain-containing protein n=1 Tax=Kolteria novifilia TaxID=2527975 RepID=A0A518AX18_9BACT|nr:hypothetical protein Pan216_01130 [Planctomycetes bacterium Pan216]
MSRAIRSIRPFATFQRPVGGYKPAFEALEHRWVPVFIDNGLPVDTSGHFGLNVLTGGQVLESSNSAELNGVFSAGEDWMFQYEQIVDVGSDGGGVQLQNTNVTEAAFLDTDGSVVSRGTFDGENGVVGWEVRTSFEPGSEVATTSVTLDSDNPLGSIQFISELDTLIGGFDDDPQKILVPIGSPGASNFEAYVLNATDPVGFSQYGVYSDGVELVNASYVGWAADEYPDLILDILGPGTFYTPQGNINTTNLPPFDDPEFGTAYGPEIVTTAFAWSVNPSATTATITTFLEFLPTIPEPEVDVLILEPDFTQACTGETVTFTATALDSAGEAVVGATLNIVVDGANPQSTTVTTNIFGQATFGYVGEEPGFDVITATATEGAGTDTAIVEWLEEPIVSSLSGAVFLDFNGDGVRQPDEPGIANTNVTISGTTFICPFESVSLLTDADGSFAVALPEGIFTINIQSPPAYIAGQAVAGSAGGVAIGSSTIVDISLPAFVDGTGYNFTVLGLQPEFVSKRFFFASTNTDVLPGNIVRPEQTANVDLTGPAVIVPVTTEAPQVDSAPIVTDDFFPSLEEQEEEDPVITPPAIDNEWTAHRQQLDADRYRNLGSDEIDEVLAELEEEEAVTKGTT